MPLRRAGWRSRLYLKASDHADESGSGGSGHAVAALRAVEQGTGMVALGTPLFLASARRASSYAQEQSKPPPCWEDSLGGQPGVAAALAPAALPVVGGEADSNQPAR